MVSLMLGMSAAIGGQTAPARAETNTATYGADADPTGDPIGGGTGYSNIVAQSMAQYVMYGRAIAEPTPYLTPNDCDVTVSTAASLKSYIQQSGKRIWVSGEIDLGSSSYLHIADGVTLASDGTGLIYSTGTSNRYVPLFVAHSNVTLHGIRLRGPYSGTADSGAPYMIGIMNSSNESSGGYPGLKVIRCEIFNWPFAGVYITHDGVSGLNADGMAVVRDSYFHHNQKTGLGYGVNVYGGTALIENNVFDYNRHHVAGQRTYASEAPTNYEVRNNLFQNVNNNSLVDCHGGNDSQDWGNPDDPDVTTAAGGTLLIHHNTFEISDECSVAIRGVPAVICSCYNNWTYVPTVSTKPTDLAFTQRLENLVGSVVDGKPITNKEYVRMQVYDNWYGTTPPASTNRAPVLNAVGNKAVVELSTLAFTISATDLDGDTLTYSASNVPQGATFQPATRTFSWTPAYGQSGTYTNVHFQVTDGKLTDYEYITITVTASSSLQGDVNGDGAVNALDMIRVGQHWGETGVGGWIREDINQDGTVNVLDATLVGQHWTG